MSYTGPDVTVRQRFELEAVDVAIESLPPAVIASAFYVGEKENVGITDGVGDGKRLYPYPDTIYNVLDWPREMYNFYPIKVYIKSSVGDVEITDDVSIMDDGIEFDEFESFEVLAKNSVESKALFFKLDTAAVSVGEILIGDATVIEMVSAMSSSEIDNIKPGMPVGLRVLNSGTWIVDAYVEAVIDSTHIKLQAPNTVAEYDGVLVGTYQILTKYDGGVLTSTAAPCLLYDLNANFTASDIKEGDVLNFKSPQNPVGANILIEASVVQVLSQNMLIYNTLTQGTGRTDYDEKTVKRFDQSVAAGINVTEYSVKRLVSLSENKQYKEVNTAAGVPITGVLSSGLIFNIDVTNILALTNLTTPEENDVVAFTAAVVPVGDRLAEETYLRKYTIQSISKNVNIWTITLNEAANRSEDVTPISITDGDFLTAWKPTIAHDVLLNYRAWNPTEDNVVQRIQGIEKIKDLWADGNDIADENELAFMTRIAHISAGGNVVFAINVNPQDQVSSYAAGLDKLKHEECYSHSIGTTDPSVNAIIPPYVVSESDPDIGHERIGILGYSEWDIYLKRPGESSAVATDGAVTITETIPGAVGIRKGDAIYLIDQDTNEIVANGILTATPSAVTTILNTDISGFVWSGPGNLTYRINATNANDQALQIAAIYSDERRIKVIWPGWFTAQGSGAFKSFPPYYITAARAGMDSSYIASQSFTNLPFAISGLKNFVLDTNKGSFKKGELNIIGGGGVDIHIQETSTSQTIKSKHDLSSDMTSILTREWSATKQVDVSAKTYRVSLKPYIGKNNITPKFLQFVGEITGIASSKLMLDEVVKNASTESVVQDPDVADKINVTIGLVVFVAGNYIDVTLNVTSRE